MRGKSEYVVSLADRTLLLQGPLGAILMLGGDQTAGRRTRASCICTYT